MNRRKATILAGILVLALLLSGFMLAPTAYTLSWSVFGGGGQRVSAGTYVLETTIGQPVAGRVLAGTLNLCSGFWCTPATYRVYLPLVLRP